MKKMFVIDVVSDELPPGVADLFCAESTMREMNNDSFLEYNYNPADVEEMFVNENTHFKPEYERRFKYSRCKAASYEEAKENLFKFCAEELKGEPFLVKVWW